MTDEENGFGNERSIASAFGAALRSATQLTRNQNVVDATRLIQSALGGIGNSRPMDQSLLEIPLALARETRVSLSPKDRASHEPAQRAPSPRPRYSLGTVVDLLRQPRSPEPRFGILSPSLPREQDAIRVPEGAVYFTRSYTCPAGSREYRLYLPAGGARRTRALVVMLHGCSQTPDDFAAGTGMNALAEEQGFIVAYPRQSPCANQSGCWNWFNPEDQARDLGEPSILAGLTRALVREYDIDEARIFVAGLSAGGAMAAILSATYPDLYSAAGIHSGLAHGAASDLVSAFAAMRGTPVPLGAGQEKQPSARAMSYTRTIVFHGTSDQTVHPSNGDKIFASARVHLNGAAEAEQHGLAEGGRSYTRKIVADLRGRPQLEHWMIDGLGHAWSGGRPDGSYTDASGPDASREMVRFFLAADPAEACEG